jgi:hypothetical protein
MLSISNFVDLVILLMGACLLLKKVAQIEGYKVRMAAVISVVSFFAILFVVGYCVATDPYSYSCEPVESTPIANHY